MKFSYVIKKEKKKRKKKRVWTQQSTKQNTIENNQETKLREEKNWTIEEHSVKPQHWDQSKRLLWHRPINSTNDFSKSSKDWRLRFILAVHVKHPGIKFQISESCFPSQWFQQNNNSPLCPIKRYSYSFPLSMIFSL